MFIPLRVRGKKLSELKSTASQVNVTRSMVLCAIGAVVGLAIAGIGLFSARGTATHTVPPEDIALVNQRPVLRSDFVTQLEGETGESFDQATRAEKLKVLDEMIREELLVQRGLELDFAETDQMTRNALAMAMDQQALAEATTSQPTEQQLREFFDKNPARYASDGILTVRHLVLLGGGNTGGGEGKDGGAGASGGATGGGAGGDRGGGEQAMQRAREAVAALRANTPVEAVMAKFGLTEPRNDGDEFYFAAKIHLGDVVYAQALRMKEGEVSEPLQAADGIHIVRVIKNKVPVPLSFEHARLQVLTDLKNAQQERLMAATMKFLRERSKVLIAPDYSDYKP
jgi:parvulin-like peptidyl-prolyl isomerase